jgi:hypothetical protein
MPMEIVVKHPSKEQVLQFIQSHPSTTSTDIAKQFACEVDPVSNVLNRLHKEGVVQRKPIQTNRGVRYAYRPNPAPTQSSEPVETPREVVTQESVVQSNTVQSYPFGSASNGALTAPRVVEPRVVEQKAIEVITPIKRSEEDPIRSAIHGIAERITGLIVVEVQRMLAERLGEVTTKPSTEEVMARMQEPQQKKDRLRRVFIVGLLPSQAGAISADFADCFDLRFWKDESFDMLKANAKSADLIVAFTSKLAHEAESAIRSVAHAEVVRCPGGMTSLRDLLMKYYVDGK